MTKFRALRNFLRGPGVDVVAGAVLELDDAEAALLVSMPGTVEPIDKRDQARVTAVDRITWETEAERKQRERTERERARLIPRLVA
jgi:hypothetical protein